MKLPEQNSIANRLSIGLTALLAGTLFFTMVRDADLGERVVAMRYFLFGMAGLIAFILPYLSFPDRKTVWIQLLNLSPNSIWRHYLKGQRMVWGIGLVPVVVIALGGTEWPEGDLADRGLLLVYGVLFLTGLWLYASTRYLQVGASSQEWQEGEKGREARQSLSAIAKYPVDPGSIPSLLVSGKVSVLGMMGVVSGAFLNAFFGLAGEAGIALLMALAGLAAARLPARSADRFFYRTHAFFGEFFGSGSDAGSGREPVRPHQLWWIPVRWTAHSWAFTLQLDRKIPAGRWVALGHLFVWVVAYQRPGEEAMYILWLLFALLHHTLLLFTANASLAPVWWLRHLDRLSEWVWTRFWVQVRWLLPLLASMALMMGLFGLFSWSMIFQAGLFYLGTALLAAVLIHLRHERRWIS